MFSLRIVNVDHYMSSPKPGIDLTYSQFRGNQIKSVPIIRVFGSTPSGVKACLHVHGVFPYLLIPYSGQEEASRFLYQLASSLDKAINVSLGTSYSQKQHVFKITQVSGRPFYGYHGQDYQYLKIFFYSPLIIKRASDLLQKGAVCGTQFQIHESHVPFILQFFIDYNLYGMSFIDLKSVVFRKDGNPAGVAPGTLAKDSFCELEADAVAVDILNRLTVEGELAVNPGLAAIWREEKERLQKDALESTQRTMPQRTMSEILLMDKLKENLRFQGKCKPSLKERIPYPVETQRSGSSEILDASVLHTHSVTSLLPSDRTVDELAVVDEELALSLSQSSATSSSLDQSLLMALDVLAAPHEDLGAIIAQNVEDDSILGSQMLTKEGSWNENNPEEDHAAVDFSLPPDCYMADEDQESDDNFDGNIPQVDGVGDIVTNKKKMSTKRKRKAIVKNPTCEDNVVFNVEDSLVNDVKDSGCWPDSGKQEGLDEIFSDEEPFNSPIHNFEDNGSAEEEPLNIDIVTSFDTVLRGDPALPCDDLPSSEELFQLLQKNDESAWNILNITNSDETCNKSFLYTDFDKNKLTDTILDISSMDDDSVIDKSKDNSISNVPLLSIPSVAADKQMAFPSLSEYLLNTCHLDEILNEDLNKGLEHICENDAEYNATGSPFHQSFSAGMENCEMPAIENQSHGQNTVIDEQVPTSIEFLGPDIGDETIPDTSAASEIHLISQNPIIVSITSSMNESQTETTESNNTKNCAKPNSESKTPTEENIIDDNEVQLNSPAKSINNLSPTKNCHKKHQFVVKMFQKKMSLSQYDSDEMTDAEIKQYFSQLEYIASYFAEDTDKFGDEQKSKSILWTPIRVFTKVKRRKIARKVKTNKLLPEKKIINFTKGKITSFNNCFVRLQRLTYKAVKMLCHHHNFKTDLSLFQKRSAVIKKSNKLTDKRNKINAAKEGGKPFKSMKKIKLIDKQEKCHVKTVIQSFNCERKEEAVQPERSNDFLISDLPVTRSTATIENRITIQATNCYRISNLDQNSPEITDTAHCSEPKTCSTEFSDPVPIVNTTSKPLPCNKKNSLKKQKISSKPKDKHFLRTINKNKMQKKRKLNSLSDVKVVNSSENSKVPSTSISENQSNVAYDSVTTINILKSDNPIQMKNVEKKKRRMKNKMESHRKVNEMSHTIKGDDNIKLKQTLDVHKKKPTLKRNYKDDSSNISSESDVWNLKKGLKLGLTGTTAISHKEMERTSQKENSNMVYTLIDEKKMSKKNENVIGKNTNLNKYNDDNNTSKLNKSSSSENISEHQSQSLIDDSDQKDKSKLKRSNKVVCSKISSENGVLNLKLGLTGITEIKQKKVERTSQQENSNMICTLIDEKKISKKNETVTGKTTYLNNNDVDINTSRLNKSSSSENILENRSQVADDSDQKDKSKLKRSNKVVSSKISSKNGVPNLKLELTGITEIKQKKMERTSQHSNMVCTLIDEKKISKKNETMTGKTTYLNNNDVDNNTSRLNKSSSSENISENRSQVADDSVQKDKPTLKRSNKVGNKEVFKLFSSKISSENGVPNLKLGLTGTKEINQKKTERTSQKENSYVICTLTDEKKLFKKNENVRSKTTNLNNNDVDDNSSKLNKSSSSEKISDNPNKVKNKEKTKTRIKNKTGSDGKVSEMSHTNKNDNNKLKKSSSVHKKKPTLKRSCKDVSSNISSESSVQNLKQGLKLGLMGTTEITHKEMERTSQKETSNMVCTLIDEKKMSKMNENVMGKNTNFNNNVDNNMSKLNRSSSSEEIQMTKEYYNDASVPNLEVDSKLNGLADTKSVGIKEIEDINGKENISVCKLNNNIMEENKRNMATVNFNLNNNNCENSNIKLNKLARSIKKIPKPNGNSSDASLKIRSESDSRLSTVKAGLKHDGLPIKKELRKEEFEQKYKKQNDTSTVCTPNTNKVEESKKNIISRTNFENYKCKLNKSSGLPSKMSALKMNCSDVALNFESKCITTPVLELKHKLLHGDLKKTKNKKINKSLKRSKNNNEISVHDKVKLGMTNKTIISEDSNLNNVNCVDNFDAKINNIESHSPVVVLQDDISLIQFNNFKLKTIKNGNVVGNMKAERQHTIISQTKKDDHSKSNPKLKSSTSDFSSSNINGTNRVPVVCLNVSTVSFKPVSNKSEPIKNIVGDSSSKSADIICTSNQLNDIDIHFVKPHQAQCSNLIVKDVQKPLLDKLQTSKSSLRKRSFSLDSNDKSPTGIKERRNKSQRIVSLDGTYDNSSSDENVEETINDIDTVGAASNSCSTPRKIRSFSSRTSRSPKSKYVPLNIEIKKSPKVKFTPLAETQSTSVQSVNVQQSTDLALEASKVNNEFDETSRDNEVSEVVETKCEFDRKRRRLEPSVVVERLVLPPQQETSHSAFVEINSEVPSHSRAKDPAAFIHPSVKRLKVSVQRLSLNAQGGNDGEQWGDPIASNGKSQRGASLPVTTKEKTQTTQSDKTIAKERLSERNDGDEIEKASGIGKGKKVRKALIFPNETNVTIPEASTSVPCDIKVIPPRKISIDMFEFHSNPESDQFESGVCSDDSFTPNMMRLSGEPPCGLSDFENESNTFNASLSDLDFTQNLTLNSTEHFNSLEINKNPSESSQTRVFTPAFHPPSRAEVFAKLRELGLPEVVNEEPFYSNPTDVAKSVEVGNTMLKLKSKSVAHLEEFEGTFNCLSKLEREASNLALLDYTSSLCKKSIILTPAFNPPSSQAAKYWLKSKLSTVVKKETEQTKVVHKIKLPGSPNELEDDKDSESLSLVTLSQSPCSKVSGVDKPDTGSAKITPTNTSIRGANVTPLMSSTPVSVGLQQSLSKKKFLRLSTTVRKSLPSISEEPISQETSQTHECDAKTSGTSTLKQLSDSGVVRLLTDSMSSASMSCQIDMVTPNNSGNYRMELENLQDVKLIHEHQHLTILTMELHIHTRAELKPNPDHDAICCIFYNVTNDCQDRSISHISGVIYISDGGKEEKMPQIKCHLQPVPNEQSLITAFVALVRKWDPDIFVGYEIEMLSWGYLLQRAYVLNVNLVADLSRVRITVQTNEPKEVVEDDSEIQLTGRIVLNLWRFLRHEVALQSYTFENIAYHVLHQRIPLFSFRTLTSWWAHRTKLYRWLVFEHYLSRVEGIVKLMQQLDLVGRTSEFARLFGIQFYEVLSRGSQFRVESMMLRLVKPLNYIPVSPNVQQRARMRAPESLPLIMEPESRFYSDPVIVLDFQSLYPSIIIAYNYCFCTCLGRVEHLGRSEMFEFGCTQLRVPVKELSRVRNNLNFSPCGVAFVNQSVVKGVLPRMLEEILNTRLMVKQSMKENKDNKTLQRVLHARQLGLKLIANVTYGYTAANFSGRMPCIEVGDSVVSKARETLERAISMVGRRPDWGARVIYGDTDSMFVLVPGKSRQEAFRIGAEIADAVTNDNPKPVKLKLEKVYQPCLLQTKKRYVGYMYESPNQEAPVYDAKGIETVRRDGCPAVAKVLEKSLRLLFETKDVSLVKRYVCRQFTKVVSGRISIQELTFAREFRGITGYRPGACVPALQLAKQWLATDSRAGPRVGQRVPYVVVAGPPGLPLIRLVRSPTCLLSDPTLKINAEYYITRVIIPPLDRCFSLIGANVASWYMEMPRKQHLYLPSTAQPQGSKKATISQYFVTTSCVSCQQLTASGVCAECQQQPQKLAVTLAQRLQHWERTSALVDKLCQSCCGRPYETDCVSLDCPVLYRRSQACRDLAQTDYIRNLHQQFLTF